MSFNKAYIYLKKHGLEKNIMKFTQSSATVKDAADAIKCKEGEIAKTICFIIDEKPILIVAAGDTKIDNAKYKLEFQTKAKMVDPIQVENLIGHPIGGVCPFGINDDVDVYLDESLKRFRKVYAACGSADSAVGLSIDELEKASNNKKWIDVCKL